MKQLLFLLPLVMMAMAACDDKDSYSVNITQDLCMFTWHGIGKGATFTTDAGKTYRMANGGSYAQLKTDSAYRMMVYYTPVDTVSADIQALAYVPVLRDSSSVVVAKPDTVYNVTKAWAGGGYINTNVVVKTGTADVRSTFGYRIDSTHVAGGDRKAARRYVSLFYRKNDPLDYYSQTICFSIDPRDFGVQAGDTVSFNTLSQVNKSYVYNFVMK